MNSSARSVMLTASLAAATLLGCAATPTTLARRPPPCAFSREADRILCDGAPYAELLGRGCETRQPTRRDAAGVPPGASCRALGLRHADGSIVTLYGVRPDLDPWGPGHYGPGSKGQAIAGWAEDIEFDGSSGRVTFVRPGFFGSARWAYHVGSGQLVELD